jgi:hypothetical protein
VSRRDDDLQTLIHLQEVAKKVLVTVKRHRRKRGDLPVMPPIPSALLTVEDLEALEQQGLSEDYTFYVFRTDTNAVLARGVQGFEVAKSRANQLRKSHGLKWDQVRFKAERGNQGTGGTAGGSGGSSGTPQKKIPFGVSKDGKTFTNAHGQRSRVEYSRNYNPSKGRRFRGYNDAQGNYHDID